jgi:hypothetical protein
MTSIMRYRADEDSGEVVPPKPHRLPPLPDEADRSQSPGGAEALEPRPPDRPPSTENDSSPKKRRVHGGGQAQPNFQDSLDASSGASTADTATTAEGASTSLENTLGMSPGDMMKNRVSMQADCLSSNKGRTEFGTVDKGIRSHSTAGTTWEARAFSKHTSRTSLFLHPPSGNSNARQVVDFYYRKAEQKYLWSQMQHRASLRVEQGHKAHKEDEEHRAGVLEHVPDLNLLGMLDDTDGKPSSAEDGDVKSEDAVIEVKADAKQGSQEAGNSTQAGGSAAIQGSTSGTRATGKPATKSGASSAETTAAAATAQAAPAAKGKSPLKELICAKKVDLDKVRMMIARLPEAQKWMEEVMDPGTPLVPKPIVYAVGMNDPGLVELLIELGADVAKPYDGPSMYKGWVKPGTTLLQCVSNRKGRFVGTMLGDRLGEIEKILITAMRDQQVSKAGEVVTDNNKGEVQIVEEVVSETQSVDGSRNRRKSVSTKMQGGNIMRHTQGHPGEIFEISETLGDQARSSCWVGFHKDTKVPVAIKVESKSDEAWLWEEVNILRRVDHQNVVKLFETFENDNQVFMVMELCDGGRLMDKVVADSDSSILVKCTRILKNIAAAVEHLHCRGICHRDIRLEHFLAADDQPIAQTVIKLIDFTTAKRFGADEPPMKTKICTPGYVAKEILTRKEVAYTEKIDIWSLGVVFYWLLSGSAPFSGPNDFEILKKVKKGTFQFEPAEKWAVVPDAGRDLITRMICPKVEDRLSASGVLEHAWFSSS